MKSTENWRGDGLMIRSTKIKGWHYLILSFVVIGFITQLINDPISIILPLCIIGLVYYLYKFPPRWLLRMSSSSRPVTFRKKVNKEQPSKKKRRPFRVIQGNKKETL
jgi:hypothetical protein